MRDLMSINTTEPTCPDCGSRDIAWTEDTQLDGLQHHAKTVKCGTCGEQYSVEYEATAVSVYREEHDDWDTTSLL